MFSKELVISLAIRMSSLSSFPSIVNDFIGYCVAAIQVRVDESKPPLKSVVIFFRSLHLSKTEATNSCLSFFFG